MEEKTSLADLERRVDEINCEIHKFVCSADQTSCSLGQSFSSYVHSTKKLELCNLIKTFNCYTYTCDNLYLNVTRTYLVGLPVLRTVRELSGFAVNCSTQDTGTKMRVTLEQ